MEIIILLLIGLGGGMASGMLGIGGGLLVIPGLVLILNYSQKAAQGTSLALLLPLIGLLAVINYHNAGYVNLKAAAIMIVTFLIGKKLPLRQKRNFLKR